MKDREYTRGGRVVEVKQEVRNGVTVGVLSGYLSTWDPDSGGLFGVPDQFERGAWSNSLAEHRQRGDRQVRMLFQHDFRAVIGGFPIDAVREDGVGLFGVGEVNLEIEKGREVHSLARQGVLVDFSVGFSAVDDKVEDGVRTIREAVLWEASVVDEPANRNARILDVKRVVPFQDLSLADRDRPWNAVAAKRRVRDFTDSEEGDISADYKNCFVWYDSSEPNLFSSYKLPISDVVDGRLTAIPRGIFAAAAAVAGARGGVDIPDSDRPGVIRHLERYYRKMDLPSPFDGDENRAPFVDLSVARKIGRRDLEAALAASGSFSRAAARVIASRLSRGPGDRGGAKSSETGYGAAVERVVAQLREASKELRESR